MNKKKVATGGVIAVAVLAAYVAATAYVGHRFHVAYEARISKLQAAMPFLQIVDRKVDKTWFKATYSASIRIGCPAAGGADPAPVIGFSDQVRFGPLPGLSHFAAAIVDSRVVLPESAPDDLKRYVAQLPADAIRTRVGFRGGFRTSVNLPAGDIAGEWGKAGWAPLAMTGEGRLDSDDARIDLNWPALSLDLGGSRAAQVKLAGIRMQQETVGANASAWVRPGNSKTEVDSIEFRTGSDASQLAGRLTNLRYATEASVAQDLLEGKLTLQGDASLQLGRDAKTYKLDKIEVVESFKRLHVPTLQRFVTGAMQSLPGCEPGAEANGATAESGDAGTPSDPQLQARAQEALQGLAGLLAYNPEIAVERIAFTQDGQRGELAYSVGIKDFALGAGETLAEAQPRLVDSLTVKARTTLPVAWLGQLVALMGEPSTPEARRTQADALLDLALAKNYVVRNGDQLTSELLFERGSVTVNGKPLGE
ncbi:MAG: YdgA family protein [Gammaproteobacteria bacterium]|nr:YdgA family protein [Gammaproteobacteria bacterium]MBU1441981.1 YdgA family protein [Gammaproteobacteria bacterium]